jgi:hypothetical protein
MSHEVNTMMMESIADDVWNNFYQKTTKYVEAEYVFIGDDGEGLDGTIEARAIFRGDRYRILPDSITPMYDEFSSQNANAKIDDELAYANIEDDPEVIDYLEDVANEDLNEDRFMRVYLEKLKSFSDSPKVDDVLAAIAEDEINAWAEMGGPQG